MRENFLQSMRWFMILILVICGMACVFYSDKYDSVKPIFPAIIALGLAFVLSAMWKDLRNKVLFMSMILTAGLAWCAQFVSPFIYVAFNRIVDINYFVGWAGLSFFIGVPVMMYVFYKYGK